MKKIVILLHKFWTWIGQIFQSFCLYLRSNTDPAVKHLNVFQTKTILFSPYEKARKYLINISYILWFFKKFHSFKLYSSDSKLTIHKLKLFKTAFLLKIWQKWMRTQNLYWQCWGNCLHQKKSWISIIKSWKT